MLAWGIQRELRRRELAEQDLAELATALSGMAVTDPLTGLGNRRHFNSGCSASGGAPRDRSRGSRC